MTDHEQKKPRMPRGLGVAGKRLWTTTVAEFELEAEPHKIELLTQACKVSDEIGELERAQKGQPLTVKGSMGQQVISPLVSEVRFQRGLLGQLLGRLGLPDAEEAQELSKASPSRRRGTPRTATLKAVR